MNHYYLKTLMVALILGFSQQLFAENRLGSLLKDHMVLQRNTQVNLWGWDNPGQKIKITTSWNKSSQVVTDKDGKWITKVETPNAGGPHRIEIKGSSSHKISDILIGDVWICSGQSNMYMPLKGYKNQPVKNSNDLILNSNNDQIRFFNVATKLSTQKEETVEGKWVVSSPKESPNFSAVAYTFAKQIQNITQVPIGIVSTSKGASRIEAWMDNTALKEFGDISIPTSVPDKDGHKKPTLLFNGMIYPLINYTAKGFLWYQGEANISSYKNYSRLSQSMIGRWRQLWNNSEMPFYFVQIAPYNYPKRKSAYLREQQQKVLEIVPHTGMAVTMDIGDHDCIHPSEKEKVGKRLAYIALNKNYGYTTIGCDAPMLDKVTGLGSSTVVVTMKNIANGLSSFGQPLLGFEVAGKDKKFHYAVASINKKDSSISVGSQAVKEIVSVRYGFRNFIPATLYNTAGIPASSFRTDNWE
ncbi:MAG: sialate O-acetylesterase [Prolixibacteraceae bacterium]|jgi:sialate O-acetylesterase|nr:sialate O-acetylesterase [Prolixibacteraceae bacterium]